MSQSLSQIYIHLVFHISTASPLIKEEDESRLHRYLSSVCEERSCPVLAVGGMPDHIHLFFRLDKALSVALLARDLKTVTSRWLKTLSPGYASFAWQRGYGAFSVSPSGVERTCSYILQQKEHHQKRSTQEEYIWLLDLYQVKYDLRYLWSD